MHFRSTAHARTFGVFLDKSTKLMPALPASYRILAFTIWPLACLCIHNAVIREDYGDENANYRDDYWNTLPCQLLRQDDGKHLVGAASLGDLDKQRGPLLCRDK